MFHGYETLSEEAHFGYSRTVVTEACTAVDATKPEHATACAAVKLGDLMTKARCEGSHERASDRAAPVLQPAPATLPAGTCQHR